MRDVETALASIAESRRGDPLAPVTVVVPSHAAGLQLRRRLAALTPFAAVRFETLPRVAELLAAGHLAGEGRAPLARPIGDYVAGQVARESTGALGSLAALPGYARVLRQIFRRIRRGGIRNSSQVRLRRFSGHFNEILRLYDRFREETAAFYDDEDLQEKAAGVLRAGRAAPLADLGRVYVMPPWALSAGASELLGALQQTAPSYEEIEVSPGEAESRVVLAPDPASEAREVVHDVLRALESGAALEEIAAFYGADDSYRLLLGEALAAAGVPCVPLPGVPLAETPAGRGLLTLLRLPLDDYPRTAVFQFLSAAPLRGRLPGREGTVLRMATAWDRISRDASVTHGAESWTRRLEALSRDAEKQLEDPEVAASESRTRGAEFQRDAPRELQSVIEALVQRLEPLRPEQGAAVFIERLTAIMGDYFDPETPSLENVLYEVEQLGTVGAVGGRFNLEAFSLALRANLETAYRREGKLGEGVLLADYRAATGLRFPHVFLCGAYEGSLPAGPGADPIIDDSAWAQLRAEFPFVEDLRARLERSHRAAEQAVAAVRGGRLAWSCPLYEPGGGRDFYPSPMLVAAARAHDPEITTASRLRAYVPPGKDGWMRRSGSPLGVMLMGPTGDGAELGLRRALLHRRERRPIEEHEKWRSVQMLRARRSAAFTEWDGNIAALAGSPLLDLRRAHSPTSLENYGVCGYRYFCRSVLRLNVVEEPEERETMDPAAKGDLVHQVLHRFFKEAQEEGRPAPSEEWTEADRARLMRMLDEALQSAHERGLTGLPVYHSHEARMLRADLARFLEEDSAFRQGTGAVPESFEAEVPEDSVAGITLRGRVDRIDRTPDGSRAWVIDYKTGGVRDFKDISKDPLSGGRKLQLPTYLGAVRDAEKAAALYWFVTQRGGFETVEYADTPENRALFERTLLAIVQGASAGVFPPVSGEEDDFYGGFENCRYCEFDRICSRRRDYELEAKQEDPAIAPWFGVAQAARADGS